MAVMSAGNHAVDEGAHEDGGGEYAGQGIFDDCGEVSGLEEMTAIENRAITTAGMGNYSAAAVWDVATRDKIQWRGGQRRGKALLAEFLPSLRRRSPRSSNSLPQQCLPFAEMFAEIQMRFYSSYVGSYQIFIFLVSEVSGLVS